MQWPYNGYALHRLLCRVITLSPSFQEKPLINHGNGGEKEKRVSLNVGSPEKKILVDVINESKPTKVAAVVQCNLEYIFYLVEYRPASPLTVSPVTVTFRLQ